MAHPPGSHPLRGRLSWGPEPMSDPTLMLLLGGFMGLVFGSALTGFLFEGKTVWPADPKMRPRQIVQASGLRIDVQDYGSRTKLGRLARRLLKLAEEYEQGRQSARQ